MAHTIPQNETRGHGVAARSCPETAERPHCTTPFDPAVYRPYLDDCKWPDEQKDEFIRELWKIVQGFVETGLGVHPIQQAMRVRKTLDHVGDDVVASPGISDIDISQTTALADTPALAKEDS